MKTYGVEYSIETVQAVKIKAKNRIEAGRAAKDIVGDDIVIIEIHESKEKSYGS